jgi:hypothetical protein
VLRYAASVPARPENLSNLEELTMAKNRKTETTTAHLEPPPELTALDGEILERRSPALPDYPDYRMPAPVP